MTLFRGFKPKYDQLPNDTSPASMQRQKGSRVTRWLLYCVVIPCNIILVALGLYALKPFFITGKSPATTAISCDCGATIDEAVAMGCKYDALSVSWLPLRCRDDELTVEFNQAGPGGEWLYWADRNGTQLLTLQQVSALADKPLEEAQFWTTFGWHVSHCSFYWRKEYRMRQKGLDVEHRYDRESHIKHCQMAFMSRVALDEMNTRAAVGLGGDRVGAVRTEAQEGNEHQQQHNHR